MIFHNIVNTASIVNAVYVVSIVVDIGAFVHYTANSYSWTIVNVADVVYIGASVNNFVNTCSGSIANVLHVVEIGASINNRSNAADIIDIANVVRTFLGLFFSVNEEVP